MIDVALHGATGRMGRALAGVIAGRDDLRVAAAYASATSAALGRDLGEHAQLGALGVTIATLEAVDEAADPAADAPAADVVIDFSSPAALASLAGRCDVRALVSGTTGLDDEARGALDALARRAPVLWAPNMSVGVNVLFHLAEEAARILGPRFDAEIFEMHHRHKVDAPSGTAARLAERVARGKALGPDALTYGRHGQVGPRPDAEIGVMTLRGGGVVGEHTLYLTDEGERLELTHRALDRAIFARGAADAAAWIAGRPPGHYTMADVLGL